MTGVRRRRGPRAAGTVELHHGPVVLAGPPGLPLADGRPVRLEGSSRSHGQSYSLFQQRVATGGDQVLAVFGEGGLESR